MVAVHHCAPECGGTGAISREGFNILEQGKQLRDNEDVHAD
jgi:hypothetical protein